MLLAGQSDGIISDGTLPSNTNGDHQGISNISRVVAVMPACKLNVNHWQVYLNKQGAHD